jgi:MoxR-like ATPase
VSPKKSFTTYETVLKSWGLSGARDDVERSKTVEVINLDATHYQTKSTDSESAWIVTLEDFKADKTIKCWCGCPSFLTSRWNHADGARACKHQIAVAKEIALHGSIAVPVPAPIISPIDPKSKVIGLGRFVGPQAALMLKGLQMGKVILCAGPTGTGKTLCWSDIAAELRSKLAVRIEGKEGMLDVDFLGNYVPRGDERPWQNGPLAEAILAAQIDPVLLYLDELSRFPREQINMLVGFLNRKSGDELRQEGVSVTGGGPFYLARVPQDNSLVFWCPCENLLIVAAANFGREYAVYPLDPALRRRFTMMLEFKYPEQNTEVALLRERTGLDAKIALALVKVASESRRVHANGELPGQIDTASLMEWALKCVEFSAQTVSEVMAMAALTWTDLVCGRNHDGEVEVSYQQSLGDYLDTLGILTK